MIKRPIIYEKGGYSASHSGSKANPPTQAGTVSPETKAVLERITKTWAPLIERLARK